MGGKCWEGKGWAGKGGTAGHVHDVSRPTGPVKWQRYGDKVDTINSTRHSNSISVSAFPRKKGLQKGVQKDQCSLLLFGSGLHGPRYLDKCKNAQLPTWKVYCNVPDRTGSLLLSMWATFLLSFFHVGIVHMLFLLLFVRFFFFLKTSHVPLHDSHVRRRFQAI